MRRSRPGRACLPDAQHSLRGSWGEVVKKYAEFVQPLGRLANGRIQEKENSLKYLDGNSKGLGGNDDRFPGVVVRNSFCEGPAGAQRTFEDPAEFGGVAPQRRAFQPPNELARAWHRPALCGFRRDVEIDEDEPPFFGRGRKKQIDQFPGRVGVGRICGTGRG